MPRGYAPRARLLLLTTTLAACTVVREPEREVSSSDEAGAVADDRTAPTGAWRPLFDGTSTRGWRGYQRSTPPRNWEVRDGVLQRLANGDDGDLVTADQFGDFELELEWMVERGANSGIMFRVTEQADNSYETGPEMQILDDAGHADGRSRLTAAGAAYGLYPAPEGAAKPAREWNAVRLVVNGAHVEHWLNGRKIVEYELWSPDWEAKVKASKFAEWPGYGRARRGHIVLQDHGDWVAFRNIRIREL